MNSYFFSQPSDFVLKGIEVIYSILDEIRPMNRLRTMDLPTACRDLSEALTSSRSSLKKSYWSSPRLTSAYLQYFLPWNLLRLCSLLPNLPLNTISANSSLLDLGSGPLTFPIALWLCREDLRTIPLNVTCCDTDKHILHLGKTIFEKLREKLLPQCPWIIHTLRSSIDNIAHLYKNSDSSSLRLISLCNVLNEREEKNNATGVQRSAFYRSLAKRFHSMLSSDGLLFSMEPGTRLGGSIVQQLRENSLGGFSVKFLLDSCPGDEDLFLEDIEEEDTLPPLFLPIAPCTHIQNCPLAYKKISAWCHFNTPVLNPPKKLQELSITAGLNKESLSLSFILMKKVFRSQRNLFTKPKAMTTARIISDAFSVPGLSGASRYACSEKGLCLIPNSLRLPSGSLCEGKFTGEKDLKSHALILTLSDQNDSNNSKENNKEQRNKKIKQRDQIRYVINGKRAKGLP